MATKRLTREQARAALGDMPERTFAQLVSEGIPREGDGQQARFPWPEVWRWYLQRERAKAREAVKPADTTLVEAERRELVAKAELRELELAERKGELVPLADFDRAVAATFARVRSKLLNLPNAVAMRVTGETLAARTAQAQALVDEIMGELSGAADVPEPEDGE